MTNMNPFDDLDDIFVDMDAFDSADDNGSSYDQLNALLDDHRFPFVRTGENTWVGIPMSRGYDYAKIFVEADDKRVSFIIDSGIYVPADKAREANKLVLLANNRFKLTGFDRIDRKGGTVTFSYKLSYGRLGIANGRGADAWLTADGDEDDEDTLDRCFGLALHTVRDYTAKFNAIVYGDSSAVDALKVK